MRTVFLMLTLLWTVEAQAKISCHPELAPECVSFCAEQGPMGTPGCKEGEHPITLGNGAPSCREMPTTLHEVENFFVLSAKCRFGQPVLAHHLNPTALEGTAVVKCTYPTVPPHNPNKGQSPWHFCAPEFCYQGHSARANCRLCKAPCHALGPRSATWVNGEFWGISYCPDGIVCGDPQPCPGCPGTVEYDVAVAEGPLVESISGVIVEPMSAEPMSVEPESP